MHKNVLKLFGLLKSSLDFYRIIIVLEMLLFLFQWIEHLANFQWGWLDFSRTITKAFVALGAMISNDSIQIINATFEYAYGFGFLILVILFFTTYIFTIIIEKFEEIYLDGRRVFKKFQENQMNKSLEKAQVKEQKKVKNYRIYISTKIKKKYDSKDFNINLQEQNKLLNKYLIGNTGVTPTLYENGFLYKFVDFNNIDKILSIFFKVINSKSPLDYIVCVQADDNIEFAEENFKKLISLNIYNKITTISDTVWRYKYNKEQKYEIGMIGVFQINDRSIEVSEFVNNFGL